MSVCINAATPVLVNQYPSISLPNTVNKMTGYGLKVWNYVSRRVRYILAFSPLQHLILIKLDCDEFGSRWSEHESFSGISGGLCLEKMGAFFDVTLWRMNQKKITC